MISCMFRMVQKWINRLTQRIWLTCSSLERSFQSSSLCVAPRTPATLNHWTFQAESWSYPKRVNNSRKPRRAWHVEAPTLSLASPRYKPPSRKRPTRAIHHVLTLTRQQPLSWSQVNYVRALPQKWLDHRVKWAYRSGPFPTWYSIITYNIIYLCMYIYIYYLYIYTYIHIYILQY